MVSVNKFEVAVRVILMMLGLLSLAAHAQDAANYRLGTGDSISIQVFQEDDLSIETRISDSGTISYPLIKTLGGAHVPGEDRRGRKAV